MALSIKVKEELQNIQFYYKKLYVSRWFIPKEMKAQLIVLENLNLETASLQDIAPVMHGLCASTFQPSWYVRFIYYWFSGLYQFVNGDLVKNAKVLNNKNLFTSSNLAFTAQYDPQDLAIECVQILRDTNVAVADSEYERIQSIMALRRLGFTTNFTANYSATRLYEAIAKRAHFRDFVPAISSLMASWHTFLYIRCLLNATNVAACARDILRLADAQLLPTQSVYENYLTANKAEEHIAVMEWIQKAVEPSLHSEILVEVAILLNGHNMLNKSTIQALDNSEDPLELAKLIVEFASAAKLDLQALNRLEQHRKNIALIRTHGEWVPDPLALDYCQDFANLLMQVGANHSAMLISLYHEGYPKIGHGRCNEFVQILKGLHDETALHSDQGAPIYQHLAPLLGQPEFWIHAQFCTIFARQPGFITADNLEEIFAIVATCTKPEELLTRLQSQTSSSSLELTTGLLKALVLQTVNRTNVPTISSVEQPTTGLKHRFLITPNDASEDDPKRRGGAITPPHKSLVDNLLDTSYYLVAAGLSVFAQEEKRGDIVEARGVVLTV